MKTEKEINKEIKSLLKRLVNLLEIKGILGMNEHISKNKSVFIEISNFKRCGFCKTILEKGVK